MAKPGEPPSPVGGAPNGDAAGVAGVEAAPNENGAGCDGCAPKPLAPENGLGAAAGGCAPPKEKPDAAGAALEPKSPVEPPPNPGADWVVAMLGAVGPPPAPPKTKGVDPDSVAVLPKAKGEAFEASWVPCIADVPLVDGAGVAAAPPKPKPDVGAVETAVLKPPKDDVVPPKGFEVAGLSGRPAAAAKGEGAALAAGAEEAAVPKLPNGFALPAGFAASDAVDVPPNAKPELAGADENGFGVEPKAGGEAKDGGLVTLAVPLTVGAAPAGSAGLPKLKPEVAAGPPNGDFDCSAVLLSTADLNENGGL